MTTQQKNKATKDNKPKYEFRLCTSAMLNYEKLTGGNFMDDMATQTNVPIMMAAMVKPNTEESMQAFMLTDEYEELMFNGLYADALKEFNEKMARLKL